jgi:hypothetical protein
MTSLVIEHKFKYCARLTQQRRERLDPGLRSNKQGGARAAATERAGKAIPRHHLDTNKAQLKLLCQQALDNAGRYTQEEMQKEGFGKKEAERWKARLAAKEAVYKKRFNNLQSTCNETATGRERGPVEMAASLARNNPVLPLPGTKVAKKRESTFNKDNHQRRKKQAKALRKGDKSSNTGYNVKRARNKF